MYRIEAARVKSALRTTDTVARLAERTFAVLLDHVTDSDEVSVLARKMQAAIALPITLDQHEVFLTSRIGVGLSNQNDLDPVLLLEAATRALDAAWTDASGISGPETVRANVSADSTSTIAA
jgi:GGDEF domain-containing protein